MASDSDIEAAIMRYVHATLDAREIPMRQGAIRSVTGEMPVMPSAVAKVLAKVAADGALIEREDGRLTLVKRG